MRARRLSISAMNTLIRLMRPDLGTPVHLAQEPVSLAHQLRI